jgi:hypothetical protein
MDSLPNLLTVPIGITALPSKGEANDAGSPTSLASVLASRRRAIQASERGDSHGQESSKEEGCKEGGRKEGGEEAVTLPQTT